MSPHHVRKTETRLEIVKEKVEEDYGAKGPSGQNNEHHESKAHVLHDYKAYLKAQDRIRENQGKTADKEETKKEPTDEEIMMGVAKHRFSILIGLAMTRFRMKLDGNTYEDLVRVFLGVKAFFFFTFDKLIQTVNKSFQALFSDEYAKSDSFNLFQKYNSLAGSQREHL